MSAINKNTMFEITSSIKYYLVDEARKKTGKDVQDITINDISYVKRTGRFGEVYVTDIFYSSEYDEHISKVAIKYVQDREDIVTEIKNTALLEKKFASRSIVQIPRYVYVNLKNEKIAQNKQPYIIYEGITGQNYEDNNTVENKSFWAGYILAIIHGGRPRNVMTEVYEEMFRRLVLAVFGGTKEEKPIMESVKVLQDMSVVSQGGCDSFGDYHQSNLMLRVTPNNEIITIALIDPTFWLEGSYDRFEDIATFFGRQVFLEYRMNRSLLNTISDVQQFLNGYNVHLREINCPPLDELYPKGFPIDYYFGLWGMMDYLDKITNLNVSPKHPDLVLLRELTYKFLIEKPFFTELMNES